MSPQGNILHPHCYILKVSLQLPGILKKQEKYIFETNSGYHFKFTTFPLSINSIKLRSGQFKHFECSTIPISYKNMAPAEANLFVSQPPRDFCIDQRIEKQMALSGVTGATVKRANAVVKVAAICGSLREGSYHRGLIRSAIELSKGAIEDMEIEHVDITSLPMVNTDLEKQGTFPAEVEAFRRKILEADSILFASPEYNFSVTAPLKNAVDWGSRPPNVWGGKAAAIVSAGGQLGGATAQFHLRQIGIYIDLHFINHPFLAINAFQSPPKFNSDGDLIHEDSKLRLKHILLSLKDFTLQLRPKC